jgi:glycosyltransferase involved in cell wall biosynthesis
MSPSTIRGLASVIIPCWNQLEFSRHCIAALMGQTRRPWELVVINNGSTDGTADYLAGVQDAASVPVTVIANATNRGFPAATNQGLQLARGEFLVLLNNDVAVTDGWLDQLIGLTNAKDTAEETAETEEGGAEGGVARADGKAVYRGRNITISNFAELAGSKPAETWNSKPSDEEQRTEGTIGLAGPMSNYAAPPQLVASVLAPCKTIPPARVAAPGWG